MTRYVVLYSKQRTGGIVLHTESVSDLRRFTYCGVEVHRSILAACESGGKVHPTGDLIVYAAIGPFEDAQQTELVKTRWLENNPRGLVSRYSRFLTLHRELKTLFPQSDVRAYG